MRGNEEAAVGPARRRLKDVTTGLYMITAICGLVDAVCFIGLGGVFAEMMTGNLLLMAFLIGTGSVLGDATRYVPASRRSSRARCSADACCTARRRSASAGWALPSNGCSS
jgi:hypothetical protein